MESVFDRRLRVVFKAPDKEDRHAVLVVCASLQKSNSSSFPKEFSVRLTDESDPFFYFYLKLNEDDYQSLRVQQGLLVDFVAFPRKFADLLEMCHKEEHQKLPKFVLTFILSNHDGIGMLNMVEINPFKHLVHLSLKLVAGSDSDVKKHLAQRLSSLHEQNEKLMVDLGSTESRLTRQLHAAKEDLAARLVEIDHLKTELHNQNILLNGKWERELKMEQEKLAQVQMSMQQKFESETESATLEHRRTVCQMQESLTLSESRVVELNEKRSRAESRIEELHRRVDVLQEELRFSRQESQEMKHDKIRLENLCADLESSLNHLKATSASSECIARESETRITQLKSVLDTTQEHKAKLSEELERQHAVVSKRELSLKLLAEEVNKANEIIRKLQSEIKSFHSKLKVCNKVVEEQEKVIAEKENIVDSLQKNVLKLNDDLSVKSEEARNLRSVVDSSQTKLEENAKMLKTNENVINWLNKQLNEYQIDKRKGCGSSGRADDGPFGSPFVTSTPAGEPSSRPLQLYRPTQPSASNRAAFQAIPEDPNSPLREKENNPPLDDRYLPSKPGADVRLPRMSVVAPSGPSQTANPRVPRKSSAFFPS